MPNPRAAVGDGPRPTRTALLTAAAMVAFAGNSLLCRAALRQGAIDPASFTIVRVEVGALVLALLVRWQRPAPGRHGSWPSAFALAVYAVAFAFAYVQLDAGTGTLTLFAAVQATMLGVARAHGERPPARTWWGTTVAIGGLLLLLLPGEHRAEPGGVALMAVAGVGWGVYSLRGRRAVDPAATTAANFARAACLVPVGLVVAVLPGAATDATGLCVSWSGVAFAAASGAVASGLGYVLWYAALRGLSATRAGLVQLTVPVLAAFGGVLLLGEAASWRLVGAGLLVLGGVAVAVTARR